MSFQYVPESERSEKEMNFSRVFSMPYVFECVDCGSRIFVSNLSTEPNHTYTCRAERKPE